MFNCSASESPPSRAALMLNSVHPTVLS